MFGCYVFSDTKKNETICRFFSYSLDGRIVPRHKILVENRVNFKLRYMLATSDEEFDRRVRAAVERRQKFESGIVDEEISESQIGGSLEKTQVDFSGNDDYHDSQTIERVFYSSDSEKTRSSLV